MVEAKPGKISPLKDRLGRWIYEKISHVLIPTDLKPEDGGEGIKKVRRLLEKGVGSVAIYTHPSQTDTYRKMVLWKYPEFRDRRHLIPIAYHQFNGLVVASAWLPGMEFYPVVTPETIAKGKNNKLKEGHGGLRFLREGVTALSEAGIILLAPTRTRTSILSMPQGRLAPTDALLNDAYGKGINFAVFVTGFEINGVTNYAKARGLNMLRNRHYTLHTGNTFTADELLDKLSRFRQERNLKENPRRPFDHTDRWLYETQLPYLVPPAYLPKNPLKV